MLKKHFFLLSCVFLFAFFCLYAMRGLDPDFGWHLRLGELILKSGIPATDPFSYSMSTYPFVDHEWMTNVAIAYLYPFIGLNGLALICAIFAFSALFLQTIFIKKQYIVFPFLLSGIGLVNYLGIRPQVLSWVFVSILLLLFLNPNKWLKFRFLIPFLMLLWANLHGSFALGVALLVIFVSLIQLKAKKLLFTDWIVVVLSVAATFLNPYQINLWREVWVSLSDSSLRWSIQEWLPAFFFFNVGFLFLLPPSVIFILRYRKRFEYYELALYFVLLFLGLSSVRHLPFWFLISIPMTTKAIGFFVKEIKTIPFASGRFRLFSYIYCSVFAVIFTVNFLLNALPLKRTPLAVYPEKAVEFLQAHPSKGNIFNHYSWGGYLIWKYDEKKVFIDGRMPSWRQENAPAGSSTNAFREYQIVMDGKSDIKMFLEKYGIDTVIIGASDEEDFPVWIEDRIEKIMGVKFPNQKLLKKQLEEQGMKVVYEDQTAVIYRK